MELSILVAKVLSVMSLSAGLGAVFSADYYRRIFDDMFNNAAVTYLAGFTALIAGSLLVGYHNHWENNWTVLITIVGWLALIKGVLIIALPNFVQSFFRPIFAGRGLKIFPYVAIFLGLLFGYFGFLS